MMRSIPVICFLGAILLSPTTALQASGESFVTRAGAGPDKGASAWLIQRFIAPDAAVLVVGEADSLPDGIAFDVPEARFRRTPRYSAFELLMRAYDVEDAGVQRLARVIHDLEVNVWGRRSSPDTDLIAPAVTAIRAHYNPAPVPMECYRRFYDAVYAQLSTLTTPMMFDPQQRCGAESVKQEKKTQGG